ncbi:MAG: alkaline phosphatase family protein [Bacteroidales bacterium]|nr:alkaline phosphatase family protein [Bacteroidales bacterium]
MKRLLYFIIAIVLLSYCKRSEKENDQYVVMLSLDGFRWDYADKVPTPNLDKIAKMGVKAESLKASFPTKTFPNHYSMATGLYPDNHGIVLNSFYDPELNRYYSVMDREAVEDGKFYGGEPIWVTAEKQGITSASYFWVGSEADVQEIHPTYWKKYDHDFPFEQRIDSVIAWLQLPENIRPHLILWYMHEPDKSGHIYGPDSKEMDSVIIYLDSLVGVFIEKLQDIPYANEVNVIITSDHGMGNISNERKVVIEENLNMDWVDIIQGYNPNFVIRANEGYIDSIYLTLKKVPHITTWKSGEVPEKFHYGTNPRTLDIVVVADSSWSVVLNNERQVGNGTHGFDNNNKDMHTIFYAYGPAFKENYVSPSFENVDIYPLITHILELEPAEIDGSLENVKPLIIDY